jgi:hypothetical protein
MQFYVSIKKNEIILLVGKWVELKNITLNKVSQAQKANVACFPSCVEATYIR